MVENRDLAETGDVLGVRLFWFTLEHIQRICLKSDTLFSARSIFTVRT